jgi:hypothetical protein
MELKDTNPLAYFKELHLLPRVIFVVGAALAVAWFYHHNAALALFGVGAVFFAVGFNLILGSTWSEPRAPYGLRLWLLPFLQALVALAIAGACLYLAYYRYRYGVFPPFLRPPTPKHTAGPSTTSRLARPARETHWPP